VHMGRGGTYMQGGALVRGACMGGKGHPYRLGVHLDKGACKCKGRECQGYIRTQYYIYKAIPVTAKKMIEKNLYS
jgi:hypothetical protein